MSGHDMTGVQIILTEEGFMEDPGLWTREIAHHLAHSLGLHLTERHFLLFEFLRERYSTGHSLTLRSVAHSGIVTTRELFEMFPEAPLKTAIRLAGLPKPKGCF
jgi:tRNA 2-thiouridine synthesizing protein E